MREIEIDSDIIDAIDIEESKRIRRLEKEYSKEVAYMYVLSSTGIKRLM